MTIDLTAFGCRAKWGRRRPIFFFDEKRQMGARSPDGQATWLVTFDTIFKVSRMALLQPSAELLAAERWVSVDGVAEHLGVAKDSVYRWIERRGLPAHRVGRLWKFKLSEVDDWVRAGGAAEPDDEPPAPDD
jgi:excisionase family DNA binding protein